MKDTGREARHLPRLNASAQLSGGAEAGAGRDKGTGHAQRARHAPFISAALMASIPSYAKHVTSKSDRTCAQRTHHVSPKQVGAPRALAAPHLTCSH